MADINIRFNVNMSRTAFLWGLAGLFLFVFPGELGSETVTLTTYYPAPSGVYTQMITTGNAYLARDGGNIAVGTTAPNTSAPNGIATGNLDVNDVYIRGAGKWSSELGGGLASSFLSMTFAYNDCTTVCCPAGYVMAGAGGSTNGNSNLNLIPQPWGTNPFRCMHFKEGTGCNESGNGWITCLKL